MNEVASGRCVGCGGDRLVPLDTYKHVWSCCPACGTIRRERKARYLAARIPGVDRWLRSPAYRRVLLPAEDVRERESTFYDYYRESVKAGAAGTKWENEYKTLRQELAAAGLSIDVKRALDVSGGPGFFARELSRAGADVVVTEYSEHAARAMQDELGITTSAYDYNTHDLLDVLPANKRTFDAVFVRYSLNFCVDLRRFARDVMRVLEPGGYLYLSYVLPTFGCALHWSHDEYTYNALYEPSVVRGIFEAAGFSRHRVIPTETKSYPWSEGMSRKFQMVLLPYLTRGLLTMARTGVGRDRARLTQVHREEVFLKPASTSSP